MRAKARRSTRIKRDESQTMLKKACFNPLSFAIAGLMAAAAAGFIAWFGADLVTVSAGTGLALALTIGWILALANSDGFRVHSSLSATQEAAGDLAELAAELAKHGLTQGLDQLKAIQDRHENLTGILKRRLNEGEIAYGRYIGLAEQVYLSVVDQLREAAITAQAASRIDLDQEKNRLAALKLHKGAPEEILALEQRITLATDQKIRLGKLLAVNESAVTVFDRTAAALAATKTTAGPDAEQVIKDLEELAARTGRYAAR